MINKSVTDPATKDHYDWMKIKLLEDFPDPVSESEVVSFKGVLAPNPLQPSLDEMHASGIANTFVVERNGNIVTASVNCIHEIRTPSGEVTVMGPILSPDNQHYTFEWENLVKGLIS